MGLFKGLVYSEDVKQCNNVIQLCFCPIKIETVYLEKQLDVINPESCGNKLNRFLEINLRNSLEINDVFNHSDVFTQYHDITRYVIFFISIIKHLP